MDSWKKQLSTVGGYAVFGLLSIVILYTVVQGWSEKLDSRWFTTLGFLLIVALSVLLWKKLALWTRVHLLGTYLIVLIGGVALYYTPEAKTAFMIGKLSLSFLVNLLIFLSLSLSLTFILRSLKLSRNIKIGIGAFGALCSVPYLIGLIKDIPLPELLRGAGFVKFLPWFIQPAFLGVVLLLPILLIFLIIDFFKALGKEGRSPLRGAFNILAALFPFAVGLMAILGQTQMGVVTRYFNEHNYGSFKNQEVEKAMALDWKSPPVKPAEGNRFWVEWEGMLQVPKDGEYEFRIQGEGNGFLYLDGKRVFGGRAKSGKMKLDSGRHTFRAAAIEDKGEGKFAVQWKGPGDKEFKDIDSKLLSYSNDQTRWQRTPRQAAQVGIDWLQSSSYDWQQAHQCFGCHVQGQVLMGLAVSKDNDYDVNEDYYVALFDFVRDKQNKNGTYHSGHYVTATQFAGLGMAEVQLRDSSKKNKNFLKSAEYLLSRQQENGEFRIDHKEAPIDQGSIMTTANSLIVMTEANKETGDKKFKKASEKALEWLVAAEAKTTQDKIQKILALSRYGSSKHAPIVKDLVKQLKSEQAPDGGWKETVNMKGSNAYATGQVLYAFKKAGESVQSPEFKKGVRFLMDNQKVDGAWPAQNTQTHRPSEFVPTMWAVIGLAGSFGEIIADITEPPDRSSVEGKLTLKAHVTNFTDSKIKRVTFYVDDKELGKATEEKDALYTLPWDATGIKEGEHFIKVVAQNGAGKQGESVITVFSGLGIKVKLVQPAPDSKIVDQQLVDAKAQGLFGQKVEKVEFFYHPEGKAEARVKIGEQKEASSGDLYGLEWNTQELPEGTFRLIAIATNTQGQQAQDAISVKKVTPLSVVITTPSSGATVAGLVNCQAEVVNNTDSPTDYVEFFLDGETSLGRSLSERLEVPCNFVEASLGSHSLKVVAHNKAGLSAENQIPIQVGEEKGPGYLKVQLKNLDQPGGEQVLYFPPDNIELVLDMSNSMWGQIQGVAKVEIAKEVLEKLVRSFPKDSNLGLRVYGHRSTKDCQDTELLVPIGKVEPDQIVAKVKGLKPKGMTPIDYSLRKVLEDLKPVEGSRVVILVTDGIESCNGDPVAAAAVLMEAGLKVKIHVVGFDISGNPEAVDQLKNISKVGKGNFFLAEDAEGLTDALAEAVKVTYSVYDQNGKLVYSKPLGLESNELMSGTYKIEVALDPPLVLENVLIEKGQTSTVDVIREQKKFRMEASKLGTPKPKAPETQPAAPETQPAPPETQPAQP